MEKKIFKYQLPFAGVVKIKMPKGSQILTAQKQNDNFELWAIVDEDAELEERKFIIIGTGIAFTDNVSLKYISTVQIGFLVWHIFEETKP